MSETSPTLGRMFVHPLFDLTFIGGGLSILTVGLITGAPNTALSDHIVDNLALCVLLANIPHFAASTVRLYTKPRCFEEMAGATMVLPLLTLVGLTAAIAWSGVLGRPLQALYLSWSPYHYAAQTYGLTVMYAMRTGARLEGQDRRLLWWACMLPFAYAFFASPNAGLSWFIPPTSSIGVESAGAREAVAAVVAVAVFVVPLLILVRALRERGADAPKVLPVICWLLILSNGLWWVWFTYVEAFGWATVFHGVQYLAIVAIFHVRDHVSADAGTSARLLSVAKFYAACLVVGYLLFQVWPYAYLMAGFGFSESVLLVVATINLHHFIVDREIWRIRGDRNLSIVVGS